MSDTLDTTTDTYREVDQLMDLFDKIKLDLSASQVFQQEPTGWRLWRT